MQRLLERAKSIGRTIGINDEKGYLLAIFLVLVILVASFVVYYGDLQRPSASFSTISFLDAQNSVANYPEVLVANQNSTFTVSLSVGNYMGQTLRFQVRTKITADLISPPVNTAPVNVTTVTLKNGQSWQGLQSVTENQVGSYSVVFELWQSNPGSGTYTFTYNFCVSNIQVVN
jgi:uncharacterized membrane protein